MVKWVLHNKKIVFILSTLFTLAICVRYLLSIKINSISVYLDELIYLELAKSIIRDHAFAVRGLTQNFFPFLYSLLISPLTMLQPPYNYECCKLLNTILISSSIFPIYLLSMELTGKRVNSLIISALFLLLPENYYSTFIMSESLYIPLSLWFLLFIAKSIRTEFSQFQIPTIALLLAMILTKIVSIAYIPVLIIFLFKSEKKVNIITGSVAILAAAVTLFLLRNSPYISNWNLLCMNHLPFICKAALSYLLFTGGILLFVPLLTTNKEGKNRNFALFCYISIIAFILTTAIFILLKEDLQNPIPRFHLRYFFPLLLPFIILFTDYKKMAHIRYGSYILIISILLFNTILAVPPIGDANADAPSLAAVTYYGSRLVKLNLCGLKLSFGFFDLYRIAISIMAIYIWFQFSKRPKIVVSCFLILFASIALMNNFAAYQYRAAQLSPEALSLKKDALLLDSYLKKHPKSTLLVSKHIKSDPFFETYMRGKYYVTLQEMVRRHKGIDTYKGIEVISIERGKVYETTYSIPNIPSRRLEISYIVTSSKEFRPIAKPIHIGGLTNYIIYEIAKNKIELSESDNAGTKSKTLNNHSGN